MIKIILKGRVPSKKNSKIIVCRGSRPILLPSKNYKEWQEEKMWELKGVKKAKSVKKITFYAPDKRSADLSNKTESILDLLVDAGIIEDDNWFIVPDLRLRFGGVDIKNPRCEIILI